MMRLVVTDTETDGLEPPAALLEVAWSTVYRDEEQWKASPLSGSLVRFAGEKMNPVAQAAHHITMEMATAHGVPERDEVVARWLDEFVMPGIPVAHNAQFDARFLPECTVPWICTYRCALHIWPDAPAHSNQVLRYELGLNPDLPRGLAPHRAAYDVAVTREILLTMLKTHSPADLVRLTTEPVMLKSVKFGKYAGREWKDLPNDYLGWCLRQRDMNPDVVHTARMVMQSRGFNA